MPKTDEEKADQIEEDLLMEVSKIDEAHRKAEPLDVHSEAVACRTKPSYTSCVVTRLGELLQAPCI